MTTYTSSDEILTDQLGVDITHVLYKFSIHTQHNLSVVITLPSFFLMTLVRSIAVRPRDSSDAQHPLRLNLGIYV